MVENKNALTPANTESDSKVNNTLIQTLPHKMVANKKFESSRNLRIFFASLLPFLTSTSRCNRLIENSAKFKPENIADCDIQSAIAHQMIMSVDMSNVLVRKLSGEYSLFSYNFIKYIFVVSTNYDVVIIQQTNSLTL